MEQHESLTRQCYEEQISGYLGKRKDFGQTSVIVKWLHMSTLYSCLTADH